MNFYLSDSNGNIDPKSDNAYIPDFFVDFLFKSRDTLGFSLEVLFSVDPYENVEITAISELNNEVLQLINMPSHKVFSLYPYMIDELKKLNKYLTFAMQNEKSIVSVGD